MYQRIRHNSIDTYNPSTLDKRRVTAPVTLPKAPWESVEMKDADIKKLEELARRLEEKQKDKEIEDDGFITIYESSRGSTIKKGTAED
jgi:hypothetical protein